ncbi:ABC transporter permease [Microbacterium sp.]|uniref:ABC transporter permease n=1 Tax=Microbacterium sp. TaxID=51671 RepID=UPI003C7450F4
MTAASASRTMVGRASKSILIELWLIVLVVVIWWAVTVEDASLYFPSPARIAGDVADDFASGQLWEHLIFSGTNLVIGLALSIVIGVTIGSLLGTSQFAWDVVGGAVTALRSTPGVVLVPVFVVAFGIGAGAKIAIIAVISMWPILLNTIDGVREAEPTLLDMSRAYRVRAWRVLWYVRIRSAMPQIMTGVRLALSVAITLLVVSEMYAATEGLGFYVLKSQREFDVPRTWGGTILLAVFGYVINVLFGLVEKRTLRWHAAISGNAV